MSDEEDGFGFEPNEQVGAEGCAAEQSECSFGPDPDGDQGLDAGPNESEWHPVDELHDAFESEDLATIMRDPEDGLPRLADPVHYSHDPPFTRRLLVCIEDDRTFVELFEDELRERGWVHPSREDLQLGHDESEFSVWLPREASHHHHRNIGACFAARSAYEASGTRRRRLAFEPDGVVTFFGHRCCRIEGDLHGLPIYVPVRPIRERCRHYRRQVMNLEGRDPEEQHSSFYTFRHCMARRSVGGAFLSLNATVCKACDHRDPPDPASVSKHLDERDRRHLENQPHRTLTPAFGMSGEEYSLGPEPDEIEHEPIEHYAGGKRAYRS